LAWKRGRSGKYLDPARTYPQLLYPVHSPTNHTNCTITAPLSVSLILNTCVTFVRLFLYNSHFSFRKNQLPASLQESFPCKINMFRKRVKNVVTSKGIGVGIE
jgi:hypothetical protein